MSTLKLPENGKIMYLHLSRASSVHHIASIGQSAVTYFSVSSAFLYKNTSLQFTAVAA
ncbi:MULTISPECIES: hypothetical protein [Pseudoalteromonas]|uniref:hypothetical protein n=1 Tax=Pseudoalteromonas TaxID=53246 RepID=UPI001EE36FAD|nr:MULTISPECIES: hypothetical protein [Pseudoalteromonas]WPU33732.1 hypothetical protein SIO17_08470 [Pseudoalteromonas piscicida]